MLPFMTITVAVGVYLFLTLFGWWKFARKKEIGGFSIPMPTKWTWISGVATAVVMLTTALSYTFPGVSIPFVQLLMRGDVLLLAPIVDWLTGRRVRWYSWVALVLVAMALINSVQQRGGLNIPFLLIIVICLYVAGYFGRLFSMSQRAKSNDAAARKGFYVEEQMLAMPLAVLLLGIMAFIGGNQAFLELRWGFTEVWSHPAIWGIFLMGVLSTAVSFFAARILLDERENTYCVPLERAGSVLAGIAASVILWQLFDLPALHTYEIVGAIILIAAILVLSVGAHISHKPRPVLDDPDVEPKTLNV